MEQEEQRDESDALKEAINQRNAADAEIERLKEELAIEQVHDDANERVGDGRKNLSDPESKRIQSLQEEQKIILTCAFDETTFSNPNFIYRYA